MTSVLQKIQNFITAAQSKSGNTYANFTAAGQAMLDGYGQSGGSSWTLLASQDYTLSYTSTTAAQRVEFAALPGAFTSDKILYVKVRDKAGSRSGYFVGSDTIFFNLNAFNGTAGAYTSSFKLVTRKDSSGIKTNYSTGTTGYGLYGYSVTSSGIVRLYARYSSSYSLTIDGTYNIEVYLLDYAPSTGNPFDFSF